MTIVVCVRTRNEAHRIGRFCEAYATADRILVADGGSEDDTVDIALRYPNVEVRPYNVRVQLDNGYWRNPDAEHQQFLVEWAKEYSPDWVLHDDCDCLPNRWLRWKYRRILSDTDADIVMAVRIYRWGKHQHFPYMARPAVGHDHWEPSLWGWRGGVDLHFVPLPPAYTFRVGHVDIMDFHKQTKVLDILPPMALIHASWDDEARVDEKVRTYRESGFISQMQHPLWFAGPRERLSWWMKG